MNIQIKQKSDRNVNAKKKSIQNKSTRRRLKFYQRLPKQIKRTDLQGRVF